MWLRVIRIAAAVVSTRWRARIIRNDCENSKMASKLRVIVPKAEPSS